MSESPFVSTSFAPEPTEGNLVTALVDGKEVLCAMYEAIKAAKQYIYIADWRMSTFIAMLRKKVGSEKPRTPQEDSRVGEVLRKMAQDKEVKIYVILYHSVGAIMELGEQPVIAELRRYGINCFAHRPSLGWSQHQKILVVDGKVAFVGGVDLAIGRWDTSEHSVLDSYQEDDYYNSTLPQVNPRRDPRLPWHDIHCKIEGPSAFDVASSFAERWNNTKGKDIPIKNPIDRQAEAEYQKKLPEIHPGEPWYFSSGNKKVQIVRSLSRATGASRGVAEHSVLDAYLRAIEISERFIYIENQFFISNHGKGGVQNLIMQRIAARIERAILHDEEFVVIIVLPIHPEDLLSNGSLQEQLYWQYRTIKRDKDHNGEVFPGVTPLWQLVEKAASQRQASTGKEVLPENYLSVHALRGWAEAERGSQLFTEQIYVHAKSMIIDDRFAIIGSANINDRSMLGDRDSEIAAVILDAPFALDLRLKLWNEHLGKLSNDEKKIIVDPIIGHIFWKERSRKNTEAFLQAFPFIPRDAETKLPDKNTQRRRTVNVNEQAKMALKQVSGHLVDFPLEWLSREDLETTGGVPDRFVQ